MTHPTGCPQRFIINSWYILPSACKPISPTIDCRLFHLHFYP
jgi:hypothetical protein